MVELPITLAPAFLANVKDQITDPGLLLVLAVVIGLPLAFWLLKRVIGLIPKGK